MKPQLNVLLIADDPDRARQIADSLNRLDGAPFDLMGATSIASGLEHLGDRSVNVVLLDLEMEGHHPLDPLVSLRHASPHTAIVVLAPAGDEQLGVEALKEGAQDYIVEGDIAPRTLERVICYAWERQRLLLELEQRMHSIQHSESQLRSVVDATADALLIIDHDGVVQYANPAAANLFGIPASELIRQPFGFPLGTTGATEIDIVRRDDTPVVAELRFMTTTWNRTPAYVASLHDMTERKRAEVQARELLREQMARAEAENAERGSRFLLESANALGESLDYAVTLTRLAQVCVAFLADWCVIDLIESDGTLRRIAVAQADPTQSKLARELGEIPPELHPIPGEPDVLRSGTAIAVSDWQDYIRKETDEHYRSVLERIRPTDAIVVPMSTPDRSIGVITFITTTIDRTYSRNDIVLATEAARQAASSVVNARLYEDAQKGNDAKSNFLAVMSHELRTPLNAILGYADLLLMGVPVAIPDNAHQYLKRIGTSARHLLRLIDGVLSFSRMEAGVEHIDAQDFDVPALVDEVAGLIEPLAMSRNLEFSINAPASPYTIHSDPGKLQQILINLLSNAVKFTPGGSITLDVVPVDDWTHFHVRDSGVGVPPEHLDKIFDPFWQVEQGRTRKVEGTGLGLSVARRLTTILGGNLVVQSTVGLGSTFTVQIPNGGPTKAPAI